MNIHNDKTLYKLLAAVFIFVLVSGFIFAAGGNGLKAGLFAMWVLIAAFIFWMSIMATINKPSGLFTIFFEPLLSYVEYRIYLMSVGFILVLISIFFWNFLDAHLPSKPDPSIPVSEIYTHPRSP